MYPENSGISLFQRAPGWVVGNTDVILQVPGFFFPSCSGSTEAALLIVIHCCHVSIKLLLGLADNKHPVSLGID